MKSISQRRFRITWPLNSFLVLLLCSVFICETALADRITSGPSGAVAPSASEFVADGFGGFNLDNINIVLNEQDLTDGDNSWFDEVIGDYYFSEDSDHSYFGEVSDDSDNIMGYVLAKDWPIGEPPGIKVIQDDLAVKAPKPTNCILATSYLEEHYLDSSDPRQVLCSSLFQTHKRYKLAMLPAAVALGAGFEQGIDLVFDVESESGSRDYQVFQKINNWTGSRLSGFKIQVGTGIGSTFIAASAEDGVGLANLSLSVPSTIWDANQLATFSEGLFGPPDLNHGRPAGFFDPDTRAGFTLVEYLNDAEYAGQTDTLTSGATLGSDYANIPPSMTPEADQYQRQFGSWLPNNMLPHGIFWDDDGNPNTDAVLIAWYGYEPSTGEYSWMLGADPDDPSTGFTPVSDAQIEAWSADLEYTEDLIDDLVNVGLSYIVTVGDVTATSNQFTIRITPRVDTSGIPAPGYDDNPASPSLIYASPIASLTISPEPTFEVGAVLTARVGDADLNLDPNALDTVTVDISAGSALTGTLVLEELGENRGVFAAILPDEYSTVEIGTPVTASYTDATSGILTASTTAVAPAVPPPLIYEVSISDFTVPDTLFVGQSGKVSLTVSNDKDSEIAVSGTAVIAANGTIILEERFELLEPNRKFRPSTTWTATEAGDVSWAAAVYIDDETADVDKVTATTLVTVKPGNQNSNNFGDK